jgi:hypothetical protein
MLKEAVAVLRCDSGGLSACDITAAGNQKQVDEFHDMNPC